jgi:hypothetical protein
MTKAKNKILTQTQAKIKIQNGFPMPFVSYIRTAETREVALKRITTTRNPWAIGNAKLKTLERGWKF